MILTTLRVRHKHMRKRRFDKTAAFLWNDLQNDLRNIHSEKP